MTADSRLALPYQPKQASRIRTASRGHTRGQGAESSVTVHYYNHSDRGIAVTERDGTVHILQPSAKSSTDELVVCVTRLMQRDVMERALDILRSDGSGDNPERDQWVRAFESALYSKTHLTLEASVEYVIYHRDFADAGGRCYMPDLDILVEWLSEKGAEHPFALSQRNRATMEAIVPGVSETTFIMMLKAVDNNSVSQRSERYVNIGGEIYSIPVERDLSYPTGVHLVTRMPIIDGRRCSDTLHRSYSFEEADKVFSLQRTVEDARNGGPIEAMAKNLVEVLTATKRVEEARLRGDQLNQDERLQTLRNEGAIAKAVQEKETFIRKNYVEWAKTVAALLGAAITVYGLWSKFKATSSSS